MAYQSAAILFGSREGASPVLVRLEGTCTIARPGGKTKLARRAKSGYRPCCARRTRLTHIAVPNRYAVGEFSKKKGPGHLVMN